MQRTWLICFLAGVMLALGGCGLEDELRGKFDFSSESDDDDSEGDEDFDDAAFVCLQAEALLAADLPKPPDTADNAYTDLSFFDWCRENLARDDLEEYVGNAAAWEADEDDPLITNTSPSGRATRPYPAHGARLKLHVLEPQGTLPFARKIHFADWQGEAGTCALEMRVYQQNPGASGKKPLLYFHGGGWRNRTTTLTAAEVLVSHLVKDHVVFMPAYPLILDRDGPAECRNARFEDILATAQEAFDWVQANGPVFGVDQGAAVDVMGHSAGGQLAAWIATRNPEQVGRFVSFYGPTEFADFIDEARPGEKYAEGYDFSKRTIAHLLGVENVEDLQRPYGELIMQNSLSEIVAREGPGAIPPFMLVQGNADTTVPVDQAIVSCNAVGGAASAAGGDHACGANGSRAIIVDGADHNLDRRCATGLFEELEDSGEDDLERYCPTHPSEEETVRIAVQAAFDWLAEPL